MPELEKKTLESYLPQFGLTSFREGQERVISTVLAGQDCLCVMPTGGGKSLCYQLPAVVHDGLTLVVSPLIALMKDQVDQLHKLGLPVSFINSTLSASEQYERLDRMAAGEFSLVYVVPERFRSGRFIDAVRAVGIKLLAIDEAHCVSEWGHDFRPDYARLGFFRRMLGNPTTIALTATATDRVRRDIVEMLDLHEPKTFITGFARPNLFYEVQSPSTERQKPDKLVAFLKNTPGSGIIYTSTRKRTEEVAEVVAGRTGRKVAVYHAGLLPGERKKAQEDFMRGRSEIVVATNAFGMGIDKADVRFVVHYNIPGTVEAYYQEAGRAGRDGLPSHCLMLYHASDRYIQEYFIESAYPDREHVKAVYDFLRDRDENPIELTQDEVKQSLNLPIGSDGIGNCEQLLESAGVLERMIASQNMATVRIDSDLPTLVDLLPKQAKTQRKVVQSVERLVGPRRQELVQFQLRNLSVYSEMDQASLARALHELNKLQSFSYIPPFRGRAIRMINGELDFDQLEIDFEAIERRKQQEYDKLERVVGFARGMSCRQREILRYFGEEDATVCGHCDNCRLRGIQGGAGSPAAEMDLTSNSTEIHPKIVEAVRMVLSGVARTQARISCGKNLIAQMLCGSNNAKIRKLRFDKLSTFGLLKHLTQQEVVELVDALFALRCLQQVDVDRFRPVVELTEYGEEVMRGQTPLSRNPAVSAFLLLKLRGASRRGERREESGDAGDEYKGVAGSPAIEPPRKVGGLTAEAAGPHVDAEVFAPASDPNPAILATLKNWREEIADESGVPAYYILTNDTLAEIARQRPADREALLAVRGIGAAKAERYGTTLLEIIAELDGEEGREERGEGGGGVEGRGVAGSPAIESPEKPDEQPVEPASPPLAEDSRYWTRRLLSAGFTIEECVAIRGLPRETIEAHRNDAP